MNITPWETGMTPEPEKCYSAIPNHVYHGFKDWYSSSMIKHVIRSAESFFYEINHPHKDSIALERGSAFHSGVEGLAKDGTRWLFDSEVVECSAASVKAKPFIEAKAAHPDKAVLHIDEIEKAWKMAQKLFDKASKINYFSQGHPELSFFWIDEETGLKLKCRPDWLFPNWMPDYKTTKSHTLEGFSKEIANYNYHLSAAMYLEGVQAVTGEKIENYHFLAINNTPPFEVAAYALDEAAKFEGHALFHKCLKEIAEYAPNAPLEPQTISLPRGAFRLT